MSEPVEMDDWHHVKKYAEMGGIPGKEPVAPSPRPSRLALGERLSRECPLKLSPHAHLHGPRWRDHYRHWLSPEGLVRCAPSAWQPPEGWVPTRAQDLLESLYPKEPAS